MQSDIGQGHGRFTMPADFTAVFSSRAAHNIVVPTVYGPVIVNRNAWEYDSLAKTGQAFDHKTIETLCALTLCGGVGAVAVDIGACWGTFTLPLANTVRQVGGSVVAVEPQIWLYNCICGTLALNDISNVVMIHAAVGDTVGTCTVPGLDYHKRASFGSLPIADFADEIAYGDIGQEVSDALAYKADMITLDLLGLPRVDMLKIDVEGMELAVLRGGADTIHRSRPAISAEHLKSGKDLILDWFRENDYIAYENGSDYVGFPREKRHIYPHIEYEQRD